MTDASLDVVLKLFDRLGWPGLLALIGWLLFRRFAPRFERGIDSHISLVDTLKDGISRLNEAAETSAVNDRAKTELMNKLADNQQKISENTTELVRTQQKLSAEHVQIIQALQAK